MQGNLEVPTILVVEDEPFIRLALADYLKEQGFLVIEACDAEEAIEVLEAVDSVALVFSDIRMPGRLDGIGLAHWLQQKLPATPLILATGDVGKTHAGEQLQATAVFSKPYDFESVARKIRATLNG